MKSELAPQKMRVRAAIRARLAAMTPEQRARKSSRARALLKEQKLWHEAVTVLFYAPLHDELDVWPLVLEGLEAGKRIALPRFNSATGTYLPALIKDPHCDIVIGKLGIREPRPDCKPAPSTAIDLVLVPGVAFDLQGHRLGRGKGYYDRLLRVVSGIKCGVAFDEQLVPHLPVAPHDYRLDCIVTPTRWITVCAD
jgi:5-formyltetrahydrofolate cyclo-ligase